MDIVNNLNDYWNEKLSQLNCSDLVRSYIVRIFTDFKSSKNDLSSNSLTLLFAQAREEQDFETFQDLADFIFFCEATYPEFLSAASKEYYQSLARLSYYSCFRLIQRKLDLYEDLADNFVPLTRSTRKIILQMKTYDHRLWTFQL